MICFLLKFHFFHRHFEINNNFYINYCNGFRNLRASVPVNDCNEKKEPASCNYP